MGLLISWPWQYSVDRARQLGWCGYVNSHEAIRCVVEDLARLRMVPPLPLPTGTGGGGSGRG